MILSASDKACANIDGRRPSRPDQQGEESSHPLAKKLDNDWGGARGCVVRKNVLPTWTPRVRGAPLTIRTPLAPNHLPLPPPPKSTIHALVIPDTMPMVTPPASFSSDHSMTRALARYLITIPAYSLSLLMPSHCYSSFPLMH